MMSLLRWGEQRSDLSRPCFSNGNSRFQSSFRPRGLPAAVEPGAVGAAVEAAGAEAAGGVAAVAGVTVGAGVVALAGAGPVQTAVGAGRGGAAARGPPAPAH